MTALLFDNDGTLIESELIGCRAITTLYEDEKNLILDHHSLFQEFRGWKFADMLNAIKEKHGVDWDEGFVKRCRAYMNTLLEKELQPIEGVKRALQQLPYTKAVVSNGPLQKMRDSMRITGLADFFGDNLVSAYDINKWKPDPEIYLHAARLLNAKPKECIVIEDSLVGVEAGVLANMKTLFFNKYDENCPFEGVITFNSMEELPFLISQVNL